MDHSGAARNHYWHSFGGPLGGAFVAAAVVAAFAGTVAKCGAFDGAFGGVFDGGFGGVLGAGRSWLEALVNWSPTCVNLRTLCGHWLPKFG